MSKEVVGEEMVSDVEEIEDDPSEGRESMDVTTDKTGGETGESSSSPSTKPEISAEEGVSSGAESFDPPPQTIEEFEHNSEADAKDFNSISDLKRVRGCFVNAKIRHLEVFTGWESTNKYIIRDQTGQKILFAAERSNFAARLCCGSSRPFTMTIVNSKRQVILNVHRNMLGPLIACGCVFPHIATFTDSEGNYLGCLKKEFAIFRRVMTIRNSNNEVLCGLLGPLLHPWTFRIKHRKVGEVGVIEKKFSGLIEDIFADADNFGVQFPRKAKPVEKALLLGSIFVIDFLFFESGDSD